LYLSPYEDLDEDPVLLIDDSYKIPINKNSLSDDLDFSGFISINFSLNSGEYIIYYIR